VLELTGQEDYRLRSDAEAGVYNTPLDGTSAAALEAAFRGYADNGVGSIESKPEVVVVGGQGRTFLVPRAAGAVCWFTFDELCNQPTGAADFAAVAGQDPLLLTSAVINALDEA
jgi:cell division protein ZapE